MYGIIHPSGFRAIQIFRAFMCLWDGHTWISKGSLIKRSFYTQRKTFQTQRKSTLHQMPDGQEDCACLGSLQIHARALHPSSSGETWRDSVHAQWQINQNKSCHVGKFPPEVVFQLARGIFPRAWGCVGLPPADTGYNSQISTLRGAEQSSSWADLRTGLWSRRGVSQKISRGFGEFQQGMLFCPRLRVCMYV